MTARQPVVLGADGLFQQLAAGDTLALTGATNANGTWRRRPDGIVEQYGKVTLTAATLAITFPTPFTAACHYVDLTPELPTSGFLTSSTINVGIQGDPTLTGFTLSGRTLTTVAGLVSIGTTNSFTVLWYAIGV